MCKDNRQKNERVIKEKVLWDKIADGYDKNSSYEEAYKLSIQKSREILKNDDKVLEIGYGTGIISLGIADKVNRVIGVDISPRMIAVAKDKAEKLAVDNVDFIIRDGYSIDYEKETFDVIFLFNVLHIVKEPASVLNEARRLLKRGGYVISATDCYAEKVTLKNKIYVLVPKLMYKFGVINYFSNFTQKDITNLLLKNSFLIEQDDVLHEAPLNYYVLAKKK